jgi:hypothetical protein
MGASRKPQFNENIMGRDNISSECLVKFLLRNNPAVKRTYAERLARAYERECRTEGVRLLVVFSQMCVETGFLKFGNLVDAEQNNFCGFGATDTNHKGSYFTTMEEGVRVHVQHLKAYASKRPTVNPCIDSRRKRVKLGSVRKVSGLAGKWAADKNYGKAIVTVMHRIQDGNR